MHALYGPQHRNPKASFEIRDHPARSDILPLEQRSLAVYRGPLQEAHPAAHTYASEHLFAF